MLSFYELGAAYAAFNPHLALSGATQDEMDFLVSEQRRGAWAGRRVELNALTSDQFIDWLENKLQAHGVRKVVPKPGVLEAAYARARRLEQLRQTISAQLGDLEAAVPTCPMRLAERVHADIDGTSRAWDEAVHDLVKQCDRIPTEG